jgi:hypothetical protein
MISNGVNSGPLPPLYIFAEKATTDSHAANALRSSLGLPAEESKVFTLFFVFGSDQNDCSKFVVKSILTY